MKIINLKSGEDINLRSLLQKNNFYDTEKTQCIVEKIIKNVIQKKDEAVKQYTQQFDGFYPDRLVFSDIGKNWQIADNIDRNIKKEIDTAYRNIFQFHKKLLPKSIVINKAGVNLRREYRPIESVGLYIPNGTAPLVSTFLMLAIPAQLAKCKEIIVATPPDKTGSINPLMLYVARRCGISTLYTMGGAQAIAAMAYGTQSIPKVEKIFGPGNQYVTQAKIQVSQDSAGAAIDMPAGPSEVLVIADSKSNPKFIASDLLAQAEHDEKAVVVLLTTSFEIANAVISEINQQQACLSRQKTISKSLENSLIVIASDLPTCFKLSNDFAPEHLILNVENSQDFIKSINNAGSVFIGPWSAEALGDYASGPNHVLPTYGYAKNYSGLGPESFMKAITFQEITPTGLLNLAPCVERLAEVEGLFAHKNSVAIRRNYLQERCNELVK